MQQNKHEYLPRERSYFMGHEVFTKKKESKIRTFLLSRERGGEGRFNSLNFNWIEIIVSLAGTAPDFAFNCQKRKIFLSKIYSSIYLLLLSEQKYLELIQIFTIFRLITSGTPHEVPRPSVLEAPQPARLNLSETHLTVCLLVVL